MRSKKPERSELAAELDASGSKRSFQLGLLTNLANPKAPIFVTSLFAATMPKHVSLGLGASCILAMFLIAVGWFALVATVLSFKHISGPFLRIRHWIDRAAGVAFLGLGVRFMTERSAN